MYIYNLGKIQKKRGDVSIYYEKAIFPIYIGETLQSEQNIYTLFKKIMYRQKSVIFTIGKTLYIRKRKSVSNTYIGKIPLYKEIYSYI